MNEMDEQGFLMYTSGMTSFTEVLGTCGKEKNYKAIAIIPIKDTEKLKLRERSLWEWSVQYAKAEGVQPIVSCTGEGVNEKCKTMGVDCVFHHKRNEEVDNIKEILSYYPADIFFLFDPHFPLQPRGMLRILMAHYLTREYTPSVSIPGITLYDARTFLFTRTLSLFSSHIFLPFDTIETISIPSCEEVEKSLKEGKYKNSDPWYSPKTVAVVLENMNVSGTELERIKACDLLVRVKSIYSTFPLTYDAVIADVGEEIPYSFSSTLSPYKLPIYLCSRLSLFARSFLFFRLIYPKAKIMYYGIRVSTKTDSVTLYNAENHEYGYKGEKIFWDSAEFGQTGLSLSDSYIKIEEDAPSLLTVSLHDVLHLVSREHQDRFFFNSELMRGRREITASEGSILSYIPKKSIIIVWDNTGVEYFKCREGTNLWDWIKEEEAKTDSSFSCVESQVQEQ